MEERRLVRDAIEYGRALEVQEELVRRRRDGAVGDALWLLEHPLTITYGVSGGSDHLLLDEAALRGRGAALVATRRGGDVTCHEPGQLVGYPIVRLADREDEKDIHLFLRRLETAIIRVLDAYGLEGGRVDGRTGVWLTEGRPRKIAAMGVRCTRWVTSHGFALNVENSLDGFSFIVPCGISDAGVTSLWRELPPDSRPTWQDLCAQVHREVETALGRRLTLLIGREALDLVGN